MIKLENIKLNEFSRHYIDDIYKVIEYKYKSVTSKGHVYQNPFTNSAFTSIFLENGTFSLNKQLLVDLLIEPIEKVCDTYDEIRYYKGVCDFIYMIGNFTLDKQIKAEMKKVNQVSRMNHRREYISKFAYNNPWLKKIIDANPQYDKNTIFFNKMIKTVKNNLVELNENIERIISYKTIEGEYRHKLLVEIGIDLCPYCNRQYITKYVVDNIKNKQKKSMADLDHFYPKSIYQLFSLSLYNFVSCCQHCNSRFKQAVATEIMYPYEEGFLEEAYFKVSLNPQSTAGSLIGHDLNFDLSIEILPTAQNFNRIQSSIKLFRLEEVYQVHKKYIQQLLLKKQSYNHSYKKELCDLFDKMNLNEEEVNVFLYGSTLDTSDDYTTPLCRLTRDIIERT